MSFRALLPLAFIVLAAASGCSKSDVSMQNDLKAGPVARPGQNEEGIKPGPKTLAPVVGKAGGVDDSIKPRPAAGPATPVVGQVGGSDDSIKPRPKP